jgi:hypothetical protein
MWPLLKAALLAAGLWSHLGSTQSFPSCAVSLSVPARPECTTFLASRTSPHWRILANNQYRAAV